MTLEQNRVMERRNRTLIEMARTMLIESNLPRKFWAKAMNTSCYIINRAMVRPLNRKTPYELFKGKRPSIAHFKIFDAKCFVHINDKRDTNKFEAKSEPRIFLGYFATSRAYEIYNSKHDYIEESPHVVFDKVANNHLCKDEDESEFIKKNTGQKDDEEETKSEDQKIKSRIQGEETIT